METQHKVKDIIYDKVLDRTQRRLEKLIQIVKGLTLNEIQDR